VQVSLLLFVVCCFFLGVSSGFGEGCKSFDGRSYFLMSFQRGCRVGRTVFERVSGQVRIGDRPSSFIKFDTLECVVMLLAGTVQNLRCGSFGDLQYP
jgi:hypothetical protein